MVAQIVTGAKMLEILALLEGRRRLRLPWLPVSMHQEGEAILAKEASLAEGAKRTQLTEYVIQRLKPTGMQPIVIERTINLKA
jgi:hypothetical protein